MKQKILLFVAACTSSVSCNVLRLVEHQFDTMLDPQLEIGSLRLYFDDIPSLQYIPQVNRSHEHVYFFPKVTKDVLLKNIDQIVRNEGNKQYQVEIKQVNTPISGVKLIFSFDDTKVMVMHTSFDTPDGRKGTVFHFFNKQLLNQLQERGKPILHTACVAVY